MFARGIELSSEPSVGIATIGPTGITTSVEATFFRGHGSRGYFR